MILASDISVGEAGVYALLGYAVVFFGIVLLMIVITALGKYFASKDTKLATKAASAAQAADLSLPPQRPRLWLPAPPVNWRSMMWSPRPQQCSWPSWPTRWASL